MKISIPDPALKRLDKLVGTWDLKGRTLDSHEDNIFGWSTLAGGFFLQSVCEITFQGFKIQSVEMISYDPSNDSFSSSVYTDFSGEVSHYHWDVRGDEVTHWTDSDQYTGVFSPDGKILTGGWRPIEGKTNPEDVSYDAVMVRIK